MFLRLIFTSQLHPNMVTMTKLLRNQFDSDSKASLTTSSIIKANIYR